jgi:glycosyltransferase involved in cell wall biosynthesis
MNITKYKKNEEGPEKSPIFFVITTLYNSASSLKATLDSMAKQTYGRLIHLIYDDGSKPELNCDSLVEDYKKEVSKRSDPYPVIYEKGSKNLGVDGAHVHCFREIEGTHFTWLDSGDYLSPSFFEEVAKAVQAHPECHWFGVNFFLFDQTGVDPVSRGKKPDVSPIVHHSDWLPMRTFYTWRKLVIEKETFFSINPNLFFIEGKQYGGAYYDGQIELAFVLKSEPICYLSHPLAYQFVDAHSASRQFSFDLEKEKQGLAIYLPKLGISSQEISKYIGYLDMTNKAQQVEGNFHQDRYDKALENFKEIKKFIRQNHLPEYYFVCRKRARRFACLSRHAFLRKCYRFVRSKK